VHLEEDTARNIHKGEATLVDFNRSGLPLMELVTEPDISSAAEARKFCEELQLLLQYIGASDANMEKGQMRCEANISIRPEGQQEYGTKVEVKNINSFKAVEQAIEFEVKRQAAVLEKGEKVKQETRGWDENKGLTFSQRSKESAHDYRYFPEPDLPPLTFVEEYFEELKKTIPELPVEKRARLQSEYGIAPVLTETLVRERALASFWERVSSELREWLDAEEEGERFAEAIRLAVNYFTSDLLGLMSEKGINASALLVEPENFAELIKMILNKEISSRVAKDVLKHMVDQGGDPSVIVKDQGLGQVNDEGALSEIIKNVIAANPKPIEDFKAGKPQALQFLVGQIMKETKGAANPSVIRDMLTKNI
jgi:aspartyl-tRNA(Asn)/glutamyl-tRNA(Gln) amidotransferase subunit B